jgi:hypothetical protein
MLEALGKLRRELQDKLQDTYDTMGGREGDAELIAEMIESKKRVLDLVEVTEQQLAAKGAGQQAVEKEGPGASSQVRG